MRVPLCRASVSGGLSLESTGFCLAHENRGPHLARLGTREQEPPAAQQLHLLTAPLRLHNSNVRVPIRIEQQVADLVGQRMAKNLSGQRLFRCSQFFHPMVKDVRRVALLAKAGKYGEAQRSCPRGPVRRHRTWDDKQEKRCPRAPVSRRQGFGPRLESASLSLDWRHLVSMPAIERTRVVAASASPSVLSETCA